MAVERVGSLHYGEEVEGIGGGEGGANCGPGTQANEMEGTDLTKRRKADPGKVKVARRLREQTTMTLKWIADRLKMGTWTHVTNRLYHLKK